MAELIYQDLDLWKGSSDGAYQIKGWDCRGRGTTVNVEIPFSKGKVEKGWFSLEWNRLKEALGILISEDVDIPLKTSSL